MSDLLNKWCVLYRLADALPADPPQAFLCQAEDIDHADEQCINAYPGCEVLWSYPGDEDDAFQDYWGNGEAAHGL